MERRKYHPDYWDEIPDDWKNAIDRMYREEDNSNRRETRRHQSLDRSLEHGWDIPDNRVNIEAEFERKETKIEIHNTLKLLTKKQSIVFILHAVHGCSFRKISKKMSINKDTVREHYFAAIKKMKNILQ